MQTEQNESGDGGKPEWQAALARTDGKGPYHKDRPPERSEVGERCAKRLFIFGLIFDSWCERRLGLT